MSSVPDPLPWAAYRFVRDVVPSTHDDRFHLHNLAIAELLFDARNAYVTEGVGIAWESLQDSGRGLVMRRIEIDFEHEVAAGAVLKVGVRAAARSRRTMTFQEAVWQVHPPVAVAVARSVHLVVGADAPGAIDLPEDVMERFEAYEGRRLTGPSAT